MPEVSVIIPVYNVEEHIAKCAHALFGQTMDDIEYVFVDDRSSDQSVAVLDSVLSDYPDRRAQVKIIRMPENVGQAIVRKVGIETSTGDYIVHCDSDDWIEPDMLEQMYNKAVSSDYDMVFCDFYIEEDDKPSRVWHQNVFDTSDVISQMIYSKTSVTLWSKMVRREIARRQDIIWPSANMGEDFALSIQYAYYAGSIGYVEKPLYHYIRRSGSISNMSTIDARLNSHRQFCLNFDLILGFLKEKGKYEIYQEEIIHRALNLKNFYLPYFSEGDYLGTWRRTYSFINRKILLASMVTIREKLLFMLVYTGIYGLIKRMKHAQG